MGYCLDSAVRVPPRVSKTAYPRTAGAISGLRSYSPQLGRWISRDPIENLLLVVSSVVDAVETRRTLDRARRDLLSEGIAPHDVEGILEVLRRMLRESPQRRSVPLGPTHMIGSVGHLYWFCANGPLNATDFLGLEENDEKYPKLIDAAKAAWEAAKYISPGSEFPAALEAFGGCGTLGLINAWADKNYKECLCNSTATDPFDDPKCKQWEETKAWLTSIWEKQCDK